MKNKNKKIVQMMVEVETLNNILHSLKYDVSISNNAYDYYMWKQKNQWNKIEKIQKKLKKIIDLELIDGRLKVVILDAK